MYARIDNSFALPIVDLKLLTDSFSLAVVYRQCRSLDVVVGSKSNVSKRIRCHVDKSSIIVNGNVDKLCRYCKNALNCLTEKMTRYMSFTENDRFQKIVEPSDGGIIKTGKLWKTIRIPEAVLHANRKRQYSFKGYHEYINGNNNSFVKTRILEGLNEYLNNISKAQKNFIRNMNQFNNRVNDLDTGYDDDITDTGFISIDNTNKKMSALAENTSNKIKIIIKDILERIIPITSRKFGYMIRHLEL